MAERGAALRAATAELETLLYSVSHDLRTPVRHIGGFAELLLQDGGASLDPGARHYADRIAQGASRLGGMLDDLVLLSRARPSGHAAPAGGLQSAGGGRGRACSRPRRGTASSTG